MSRNRVGWQPRRIALEQLETRTVPALVAAYGFEEGSGSTALDSSGQGNPGSLAGPGRVVGKFGQALSFNGAGNLVTVADSNSLDLTGGMTLEAWVYPTAASDGFDTIVLKERGTTSLAYALYAADGAGRPPSSYINVGGSDRNAVGTSSLPVNTWTYLAATYNGSALRLYVNGTQVASRNLTGSAAVSANALRIGGNTVWGEYFSGLIDEVRIYNTALSAAQIQTDMTTPVVNSGPDTTPPTVSITAPANSATLSGTVTVSANSSDNVGVVGVQFLLDGANLGNEDLTSPYSINWNTTTITDGAHVLTAVARDAAGNAGTSGTVTVTVRNTDTTPPTVSLTTPANNASVAGTVGVSANASDNVGVIGVRFQLDGNDLGLEDISAPYSINWNTTAVSDGTHVLTAVARDAAGNTSTSGSVTVTVANTDSTPPTVSITAPADNATVTGSVSIAANASDNVAVLGVQFQLDGANLGGEDTTSPYSINWNTTTAVEGAHQMTAIARDAAGNRTSTVVNVTVSNPDTVPPTVSLTAPTNNATVSGSVSVSANASDNVGVVGVQFLLDGSPVGLEDTTSPYSITWDTTTASNGSHTLSARARDAAGNTTISATRTVTVFNTDPSQVGQWSSVMSWPLVAINTVLLDNGKVLMWDGGPECIGAVSATVWDPATNTFSAAPSESQQHFRDIFCSGQTVLADGRVLVVGGHECNDPGFTGVAMSNIFDPATQTWTHGPDMAFRRWYPTIVTRPDGKALVIAGAVRGNTDYVAIPELYDPVANTWTRLDGASQTIPDYSFVFNLPDGRVLVAGSDEAKMATYALDVAGQSWSVIDPTVLDAGSAVMYAPGKIMKAGSSYLSEPADNGGSVPSAATTYVLDMTQPSPRWQQTASMAFPRTHLNLTVLPDGSVLATGGSTTIGGVDPATGVLPAELWNPTTRTWTTLASMSRAREYHSTATLLPDGRVLVAGSGHNYANSYAEFSGEIYSPPYLFRGPRPTITSSPGTLAYGSSVFVGTPDAAAIASVALIRNGSVTHSINMNQQLVPLGFTQTDGGLTVQAPADANTAPPGYYMLYIVNANGVPSVAPFVRLPAPYEDVQPPTAPTDLVAATVSDVAIGLSWMPSTDNVGVIGYNVYRSTTSGFTPSAANQIAQTAGTAFADNGLPPGTFYYRVIARDAAGNLSLPSNEASASVTGDTTNPTVAITSPANGATVSGSLTVSADASDNVAVAGVRFFLDGNALGTEVRTSPYSVNWNTTTVPNGSHVLTALARDAAGNTATSSAITVTVSNTTLSGLVAAYGFEEGSGPTVADSSANRLNGTISGATWTTAGKYGKALSFNGSSNWVTVPDANALDLTSGMTLEAWVRPSAPTTGYRTVLLKEQTGELAYALYAYDSDHSGRASGWFRRSGSTTSTFINSTNAVPTGAWTHLAATFDGTTLRFYVNGVLVGSKAATGPIGASGSPLRIGGNSIWGEYYSGLIDEVRIYNRALSQAEIQTDLNTPVGGGGGGLRLAAAPDASGPPPALLTQADLEPLVAAAISRWAEVGDPGLSAGLAAMPVRLADLPGTELGFTSAGSVWIDRDAAGYGWFIDPTPDNDVEFPALPGSAAFGKPDLLTVVAHEFGHVLGLAHDDSAAGDQLMDSALPLGTRRLPDVGNNVANPSAEATLPTNRLELKSSESDADDPAIAFWGLDAGWALEYSWGNVLTAGGRRAPRIYVLDRPSPPEPIELSLADLGPFSPPRRPRD